ncbi:MAG TPA: hypothetical protein VFQ87_06805 [Bradyrhizobium sp.]|jgi:hypothetical protein|nr:hypothetical protein [Bradyrhizobium sp.]
MPDMGQHTEAVEKPPEFEDHSKKAFEDTVRAILTTFGVFTGFAIKSTIDGINFPTSPSWCAFLTTVNDFHLFICIATVSLLLRFIVGSAVHLNLCYVAEPRSKKPVMLFKDLAFLVVFGLCAIYMIKTGTVPTKPGEVATMQPGDVPVFANRASLFIIVGLIWSAVDWFVRLGQSDKGEQALFSCRWIGVDIVQLALIAAVLRWSDDPWRQSFWLAAVFALALYVDMKIVLAARKLKP